MPLPAQVRILMSQHIGAPAKALVKKGDEVFVGTKIGEAGGFVSANIHSSVSGTVAAVEPFRRSNGPVILWSSRPMASRPWTRPSSRRW